MIKIIKSELFIHFEEKLYDVLLHGCNCMCDMDDGFARHVRLLYPNVYQADQDTPKADAMKLGRLSYAETEHGTIVNMYTQFHGGENFDIKAFEKCMERVEIMFKDKRICMPKIGCGIGGAVWEDIEKVLNEKFPNLDITVFDFLPRNNQLY